MTKTLAEKIYRELHPRSFPYCSYEKQMELSDLWPCEQEGFKRMIEEVAKGFKGSVR